MSFSADWLALREPVDLSARDGALLAQATALPGRDAIVLDLGSGTGSTARAFGFDDCSTWTWRFVDGDEELLNIARARHPGSQSAAMNLRDIDDLPLEGVSLVTASALLDLMPLDWMTKLAIRLKDACVPFYAALNYDGVMDWSPAYDADSAITAAFNAHQQTDKGIGPAMGPQSGRLASQVLAEHGFDVTMSDSPWRLGAEQATLHGQLISGIGEAAHDVGCDDAAQWVHGRMSGLEHSQAVIGHTDLLAIPRQPH